MTNSRHSGRVVLVTGAGGGIGAAIAELYCQEGAVVALVDADAAKAQQQAEALREAGFTVGWAQADVADYQACADACERLVHELGPIDTLINNAGISPKHDGAPAPIWTMAPEEWQRVVNINLNGSFNLVRVLTPGMVERGFGRIVNMSSVAGSAFLPIVAAHYSATKAAIIGFTRHLAGEGGSKPLCSRPFPRRPIRPWSTRRRCAAWEHRLRWPRRRASSPPMKATLLPARSWM